MSKKTSQKRATAKPADQPQKLGRGGNPVPANGKKFSKQYQPSGQAKAAGKLAKKRGHELAQAVLQVAFKGMKNSELKKMAAEYFGVDESEITVETMLLFRQAEKAIQKADTNAFNAIMNRAFGLPKQKTELTGEGGKDLIPSVSLTSKQIQKLVDKL
jgi:hypothetical protein